MLFFIVLRFFLLLQTSLHLVAAIPAPHSSRIQGEISGLTTRSCILEGTASIANQDDVCDDESSPGVVKDSYAAEDFHIHQTYTALGAPQNELTSQPLNEREVEFPGPARYPVNWSEPVPNSKQINSTDPESNGSDDEVPGSDYLANFTFTALNQTYTFLIDIQDMDMDALIPYPNTEGTSFTFVTLRKVLEWFENMTGEERASWMRQEAEETYRLLQQNYTASRKLSPRGPPGQALPDRGGLIRQQGKGGQNQTERQNQNQNQSQNHDRKETEHKIPNSQLRELQRWQLQQMFHDMKVKDLERGPDPNDNRSQRQKERDLVLKYFPKHEAPEVPPIITGYDYDHNEGSMIFTLLVGNSDVWALGRGLISLAFSPWTHRSNAEIVEEIVQEKLSMMARGFLVYVGAIREWPPIQALWVWTVQFYLKNLKAAGRRIHRAAGGGAILAETTPIPRPKGADGSKSTELTKGLSLELSHQIFGEPRCGSGSLNKISAYRGPINPYVPLRGNSRNNESSEGPAGASNRNSNAASPYDLLTGDQDNGNVPGGGGQPNASPQRDETSQGYPPSQSNRVYQQTLPFLASYQRPKQQAPNVGAQNSTDSIQVITRLGGGSHVGASDSFRNPKLKTQLCSDFNESELKTVNLQSKESHAAGGGA